jgi:WD40 repeat protein
MAESENAMKRSKWFVLVISLVLAALLLDACTFSVEVLSTPTSSPPLDASATPTLTPPAGATPTFPSATPTFISIRADTIPMLEIFNTFQLTDVVRTLAFTPNGTVLAAAGGNAQDFAIHLWDVLNGQSLGTLVSSGA